MKPIFITITAGLLAATLLPAQATGNAQSAPVSTVGNMDQVMLFDNAGTANYSAANATNAVTATGGSTFLWNSGQTRQYYNQATGKWETSPVVPEKANAALPYDNTVIFDADVMINVKASSYTAIFSSTDFGGSVFAADSALSARLNTFLKGLKKDSILEENIHIDFISMLPVYEVLPENKVFSNIATEKPAGFKIKKNIHVLFYDHRKLDRIITSAAAAGIYDLVKVDYNVNNIEAAYDTLRKVAVNVIDMKRMTYQKMSFTTYIVSMAEGYDSKYPEERYESYTAYLQGMSMQNAQQQNPNLQVRPAEKEQTIFYNKVPYKQFDRVLNADLAEPGVQFYYKLRVKCRIEHVEEKPAAAKPGPTAGTKPAGTTTPPSHQAQQPARKP